MDGIEVESKPIKYIGMSNGNDSGLAKLALIFLTIFALLVGWMLFVMFTGAPLWVQLIFAAGPVVLLWGRILWV
jgi:hypothetical protein